MLTPQFVTAGKAIFTATNVARGTRLTFKVEKPEIFRGEFFAAVMKGTDNENDYLYVGMVKEGTLFLRETKGSKHHAGSPEFEGLKLVLSIIAGRRPETPLLDIQHAGKCGRCNRTLTVPESIASGIGPECAEQLGLAVARVTKPVKAAKREPVPLPEPEPEQEALDLPLESDAIPASFTSSSLISLARALEAVKEADSDESDRLRDLVGF